MNYSKLIFRENSRPGVPSQTVTIDFTMDEIIVNTRDEGIKWCRIGSRERSTIEAKLNVSRPDEWAENYAAPVTDGSCWDLRLFEEKSLVKESIGRNGYPPNAQWEALCSLATFCSAVARRYGERPKAV